MIYELCKLVLDTIVTDWPNTAPALPDRQYVANGEVAWDCAQLVVQADRVFGHQGDVASEQIISDNEIIGMRGLVIGVWLIRCTPDIEGEGEDVVIPTQEELDASAVEVLGDADRVWDILVERQSSGDLGTCNGVAFESWNPAGPFAGIGGGVLRFRAFLL